jgi:hypothetical protein
MCSTILAPPSESGGHSAGTARSHRGYATFHPYRACDACRGCFPTGRVVSLTFRMAAEARFTSSRPASIGSPCGNSRTRHLECAETRISIHWPIPEAPSGWILCDATDCRELPLIRALGFWPQDTWVARVGRHARDRPHSSPSGQTPEAIHFGIGPFLRPRLRQGSRRNQTAA